MIITNVDRLRPGALFRFVGMGTEGDSTLNMCLWTLPRQQMATPDDTRVLVRFGFAVVGIPFMIIEREWHDCNVVQVFE